MPDAVHARAVRVPYDHDPFAGSDPSWARRGQWPARWIAVPGASAPVVAGYRLALEVEADTELLVHVSADERYALHLDGALVGRGPERSEVGAWAFETYRVTLPAGRHWLAAQVWSLGDGAPYAQQSFGHGFLVATEPGASVDLDTGRTDWRVSVLPGHGTRPQGDAWGCGLKHVSDGRLLPWGWTTGGDRLDWTNPVVGDPGYDTAWANDMPPGRMLRPALLPPQWEQPFAGGRVRHVASHPSSQPTHEIPVRSDDCLADELVTWQGLLTGGEVEVPPWTCRRVLIDLEEYVCAYPELSLRGGRDGRVRVHWQESLYEPAERVPAGMKGHPKGHRDAIEGKLFGRPNLTEDGAGDLVIAGGGAETHTTLWWEAGRYVELLVSTSDDPLTLTGLRFVETRYPYEDRSSFRAADPRLDDVGRLAFRTLQMCSHETTMDCPYYEQLQYGGDTRLQLLAAYATSDDDRLARQALLAFDRSRDTDGLTRSRTPSRVRQTIPPFSLWWVAMVHDFALWRGDLDFVAGLMPGVRAVIDAHRRTVDADGVFHAQPGWNFTDWVDRWPDGAPPGGHWDVSGVLHLQLAHVAGLAAELEGWLGEDQLAARDRDLADRLLAAAETVFWDAGTGLYADDRDHTAWSEHAQCLALLAGAAHGEAAVTGMLDRGTGTDLARTTVYFDHYLFDALYRVGRADALLDRLGLWFGLVDEGLRTVIEQPEPSRSDCHAWGAHPLYHRVASLLGIRPTAPGMREVVVAPDLGGLAWAEVSLPTVLGTLHVRAEGDAVRVNAPEGMTVRRP
ncbi:hypothetical protein FHX74_001413 [Friedmanniella endophytica]|uniref:Alpha-L-rhamnosidase n=1 Tax=Microlunatus kandeliicorticis TaxID=1759536 RepID=A0A7W3IRB9_9ACTN|nr:alpha-L-rhamnosidase [Microlunatus kandeliicorticis]MBA8793808.1 hypothetical protein [Microlunatus kandeliicorticis]